VRSHGSSSFDVPFSVARTNAAAAGPTVVTDAVDVLLQNFPYG
jgi:hypothetical protein